MAAQNSGDRDGVLRRATRRCWPLCVPLCLAILSPHVVAQQPDRGNAVADTVRSHQALIQELFDHVRFLQEDLRQLRGQVDQQGEALDVLRRRQVRQYDELEQRLVALEGQSDNADASDQAAVVAEQNAADERRAYLSAYGQVKAGRYPEARQAFQNYLSEWPGGENAPNAVYWLGDLALAAVPTDLSLALSYFERLVEDFPGHARVPDALFKQGKIHYLQGNRERARELLEHVVRSYSGVPGSAAARLATSYLRQNF